MRPRIHPSPEALARFARGIASQEEAAEVVAHLLRRCACCAEIVRCMVGGPLLDPDIYDPVFERATDVLRGLRS
jgi:hypothetical protein